MKLDRYMFAKTGDRLVECVPGAVRREVEASGYYGSMYDISDLIAEVVESAVCFHDPADGDR